MTKIVVLSYSLTGNNDALARSVAKELGAEHIKITESKPRTMRSIFFDLLFGRIPQGTPSSEILDTYAAVLLLGPVWMGHVATPLRVYLKYLESHPQRFAFAAISGGADGPTSNSHLPDELKKRTGREPVACIDLHIADLLPSHPKPTRDDTSAYHLKEKDIKKLTHTIVQVCKKFLTQ